MDPDSDDQQLVPPVSRGPHARGVWTQEEHDKFLAAVALHPHGPWQTIAALVGSRSVRQVQTHAQKYHEKVNRRARGLQKNRQKVSRQEHRVDEAAQDFLARPRGGKGQKRGKYNKRNRDARVAPIPPRPARAVLPATTLSLAAPPSSILEITATTASPSVSVSASPALAPAASTRAPGPLATLLLEETKIEIDSTLRPPPVACDTTASTAFEGNADMVEAPLPSPSEVASPDVFKSRSPPRGDLLLEAAELFPLTDDDNSRPATPLVLASPAPSPSPSFPTPVLTAEAIDSMLYDDVVAVEEAPEHALSIGEAPTLNDALDYFLRVMTAWGPTHHGSGSAGGSPISGSALR